MKRKNPKHVAVETTEPAAPAPHKKRSLKALERKAAKAMYEPTYEDPIRQLRLLTLRHKGITVRQQSLESLCRDRVVRKGPKEGEVIPCPIPADTKAVMLYLSRGEKARPTGDSREFPSWITSFEKEKKNIEAAMLIELRKVPVYSLFLKHVYGLGPIVAAYLISEINIHDVTDENGNVIKARKPSGIIKYCGMSIDTRTNRIIRRTRGEKNGYNAELRKRIYQCFTAMLKNASPKKNGGNVSSKYLDVWAGKKTGLKQRVDANGKLATAGFAHSAGWHTAARVLLNDLYTVWRAIEGLDVWPDYYAAKLGYGHNGKIVVNAPVRLSVEGALELVGHVGKYEIDGPLALYNGALPEMLDEEEAAEDWAAE